jgi:putative restriction endonuclease
MKFYVGVTDNNWFRFLAERKPDEVNFWRPKNQNDFKAIGKGDLFLFKLHAPINFIVGGGFLLKHEFLPLAMAWAAFGEKNGSPDFLSFEQTILSHRETAEKTNPLGCTVLVEPFFWPRDLWIPIPAGWSGNIVAGKTYDTETQVGQNLWSQVRERLQSISAGDRWTLGEESPADRYGQPHLVKPRLGQGSFRIAVADVYQRRCAITGEKTLPALEASHIQPYSKLGPHFTNNGILLRSDLHNLFDQGYLTVTLDYRVEVSGRIRKEFENGRYYYSLHGQPLTVLPRDHEDQPAKHFLEWHQQNCYQS